MDDQNSHSPHDATPPREASSVADAGSQRFKYDLFISYSTRPDYRLARDTDRFIESFHDLNLQPGKELRRLSVCRDGSEFVLAKSRAKADTPEKRDEVWDIIEPHLAESSHLLLFACPESAGSSWVEKEVAWFLKHRPENVWIAVTAGEDGNIHKVLPKTILEHGIDQRIWFDFRGYRGRPDGASGQHKEWEDEMVRLASNLHDLSPGILWPLYEREKRKQARARARLATILACIFLALAVAAGVSRFQAVKRKQEAERSELSSRWSLHRMLLEQNRRSHDAGSHEQAMMELLKAEEAMPGQIESSRLLRTVVQGTALLWDESVPFEALASPLMSVGPGRMAGLRRDGMGLWDNEGKLLKVIPLKDGNKVNQASDVPGHPTNFAVSPDGAYFVWARQSGAGTEYVFQSFEGTVLHVARPGHGGVPLWMAAPPGGAPRCVIVTSQHEACLIEGGPGSAQGLLASANLREAQGDSPDVHPAAWRPWCRGAQVIFAHPSRTTLIFEWKKDAKPTVHRAHGEPMSEVHLAADQRTMYGLKSQRLTRLYRWPVENPDQLEALEIPESITPHPERLSRIFGYDATRALLFSGSGQHLIEGKEFRLLEGTRAHTTVVHDVVWDRDAARFTYTQFPLIHLGDLSDPTEAGRIKLMMDPEMGLSANPWNNQMVITSETKKGGTTRQTGVPWTALAYSPDGRYLALGNAAGTLQLRESLTGRLVNEKSAATEEITSLAFAPDHSARLLITTRGGQCSVMDPFTHEESWRQSTWPLRLMAGAWHPKNGDVVCVGYRPVMANEIGTADVFDRNKGDTLLLFDPQGKKKAGYSLKLAVWEGAPQSIHFSHEGDRVMVMAYDKVELYDAQLKSLGGHSFEEAGSMLRSTLLSSQTGLLYACLADGRVFSCDPRTISEKPQELFNLQSKTGSLLEIGPHAFMALPEIHSARTLLATMDGGKGIQADTLRGGPARNEAGYFRVSGGAAMGRARRVIGAKDLAAAAGSAFAGIYTVADSEGHLYTFNAADTLEEQEMIPEKADETAPILQSMSLPMTMNAPAGSSDDGAWFLRIRGEADQAELRRRLDAGDGNPLGAEHIGASLIFHRPDGSTITVSGSQKQSLPVFMINPRKQVLLRVHGEAKRQLQLMDLRSGDTQAERDISWTEDGPYYLGLSPDGGRALVASPETGEIVVYALEGQALKEAGRLSLRNVAQVSLGHEAGCVYGLDVQGHLMRWNLADGGKPSARSEKKYLDYAYGAQDAGVWGLDKDDPTRCVLMEPKLLKETSSISLGMRGEQIGMESSGQFLMASNSHAGRLVVDLKEGRPLFEVPPLRQGLNDYVGVVHDRRLYLSQFTDDALAVDFERLRALRRTLLQASVGDRVKAAEAFHSRAQRSLSGGSSLGALLTSIQRESVGARIRNRVAAEKEHIHPQIAASPPDVGWLASADIYSWPAFTWDLKWRTVKAPTKSLMEVETTLDPMWSNPGLPSGSDLEALKTATNGKHPLVLATEVAQGIQSGSELYALREKAEEARAMLEAAPAPFLVQTHDVIYHQLAFINFQLASPDPVVEAIRHIKLWRQDHFQMLQGVVGEYKNLGQFGKASALVQLVEEKVGALLEIYPDRSFLLKNREPFTAERPNLDLLEAAQKRAPYLPAPVVNVIHPSSPALAAGLRLGDIVYVVDGQVLQIPEPLLLMDTVPIRKIKIWRSGAWIDLEISFQGVFAWPLRHKGYRTLVVQQVTPGSQAEKLGIKPFDVLIRQGSVTMDTIHALKKQMSNTAASIPFTCFSPGALPYVTERSGGSLSWRGSFKTVEAHSGELGVYADFMYLSEPLLRDQELPEKLGW